MSGRLYFKTYHTKFRRFFTKDVFDKFYNAIVNEIMKATSFRFSKEVYTLFRRLRTDTERWEAFDKSMQELYDFDIEHYFSMCQYLFGVNDDTLVLLEFYALLELEATNNPFADPIEGKIEFLLDEFYTMCDNAVEEYFNADRFLFEQFAQKYASTDIPDMYGELIRLNIANKNYRRAFVHLARALFLSERVCLYKDSKGIVREYKLQEVTNYGSVERLP